MVMHRVSILLLGLAIACGTTTVLEDESLAENTATGKEDSLFQELVFGSYANADATNSEIVSLELIDTEVDELPRARGKTALTPCCSTRSTSSVVFVRQSSSVEHA
jgi:hypothetical protein